AQVAADLRFRDRRDEAPFLGLLGQFLVGPVRDRPPRLLRRLAGQRQDLRDLLGRELAGVATARRVGEYVRDGAAEGGVRLGALDLDQFGPGPDPAPPPQADRGRVEVDGGGDRTILLARDGPQDDL